MDLADLLRIARGDAPADLVLRGGRIVNVFSGEIEQADIAIAGGMIAGVGPGYEARNTIDLKGAYVAPGLIDAHVHIESSLCIPPQFAAAVVPRGVTTVVADPHEIGNVCGDDGVRFMHDASRDIALRVVLMAPSCVPATEMATAGAAIGELELGMLSRDGVVHGLAEMMNFPGTIAGELAVRRKLWLFQDGPRDGHAPGVRGKPLNAYIAAGVGSDHECVTIEEAKEKLARGMYVLIREATNARNLESLLQLITPKSSRRICLCTDDRTPPDLLGAGSVDFMLRRIIEAGVDPMTAIQLCTINPSEWFRLPDRGAIAPGRVADLIVFDDLESPNARNVFIGGEIAAAHGEYVHVLSRTPIPEKIRDSCHLHITDDSLRILARSNRIRAIGSLPDQLITDHRVLDAKVIDGCAVADISHDVLKMAVFNRHRKTGNIGLGFIQGIGLRRGAIAGTVAHDHHNLVIIGADDASMLAAARAVVAMRGGLVAVFGENVLASLPLPVAGLMSDRPVGEVRDAYVKLLDAAKWLGSPLHDPFMAMSFMALEVIPKLKLTDQGLVDVERFEKVDLFV